MTSQPKVTVGLRLCPSSKGELAALVEALKASGETPRQEDVVGALLHRAHSVIGDQKKLAALAADARAQRVRSKQEGF